MVKRGTKPNSNRNMNVTSKTHSNRFGEMKGPALRSCCTLQRLLHSQGLRETEREREKTRECEHNDDMQDVGMHTNMY